ncbi:MAG: hypothetical protein IKL83_03860 [Muribaculaceae bacterium]|nr:hypothetical protein [Muribaculaceae bacterium]
MEHQREKTHPEEPPINWDKMRCEIAARAMVAMIDKDRTGSYVAVRAVELANIMIDELKRSAK